MRPSRSSLRKAGNNELVVRDNPSEFLVAASKIYELLCDCAGKKTLWADLSAEIRYCLMNPTRWEVRFPDILSHGGYDRFAWRRSALQGVRHDWDRMSTASEFAVLDYAAGSDLKWFLFHVEAGKQRDLVLGKISGAAL